MSKELAKNPKITAAHIFRELIAQYPEGVFELFLHIKGEGRVRRKTGSLETLMPHFIRFCEEFPEAVAEYNPENLHGIVSVITCDCSEIESCPCIEKCKTHSEIPRIFLRLLKNGPSDVNVDSDSLTLIHDN